MTRTIAKRCWPKLFQKMLDGNKLADVRLADFDLRIGDVVLFNEYNPVTSEYTGRNLSLEVKRLNKVQLFDFNSFSEVNRYGHYLIELGEPTSIIEGLSEEKFKLVDMAMGGALSMAKFERKMIERYGEEGANEFFRFAKEFFTVKGATAPKTD